MTTTIENKPDPIKRQPWNKLTLRKVVNTETHWVKWEHCFGHAGAHSNIFTLECGHQVILKGSAGLRARCHCRECAASSADATKAAAAST